MRILVGECTGQLGQKVEELGWGRMWIARSCNIYTYPDEPWGFDNGAYRDYSQGQSFNEVAYRKSLGRAIEHGVPYMAVAPDIVAGGERSLAFSVAWRHALPDLFPWYLAVQDEMNVVEVGKELESGRWKGIFLGGSTSYKSTATYWRRMAHSFGLRFHYGRCGTPTKLEHAYAVGADSIDSAFPMWTTERWNTFVRAWKRLEGLQVSPSIISRLQGELNG